MKSGKNSFNYRRDNNLFEKNIVELRIFCKHSFVLVEQKPSTYIHIYLSKLSFRIFSWCPSVGCRQPSSLAQCAMQHEMSDVNWDQYGESSGIARGEIQYNYKDATRWENLCNKCKTRRSRSNPTNSAITFAGREGLMWKVTYLRPRDLAWLLGVGVLWESKARLCCSWVSADFSELQTRQFLPAQQDNNLKQSQQLGSNQN